MSCSNFECDVGYMSNAETVTNSGFECDVGYMLNAEAATIPGHTSASIFTYEFEDGPIGESLDLACAGISLRVRTLASSPASLGVSTFADELRMDKDVIEDASILTFSFGSPRCPQTATIAVTDDAHTALTMHIAIVRLSPSHATPRQAATVSPAVASRVTRTTG